jgi:hypothetical protein
MKDEKRNMNNPIKERLNKYSKGEKVVIQWGNLKNYNFADIRANDILTHIKNIKLKRIGLKNKNGFYYHPRYWNFINGVKRFKEEIIPML